MDHIYAITEKNVDGCGTDATVYAASPCRLSSDEERVLKECLDSIKRGTRSEDWDTDAMVDGALEQFSGKTGRELRVTGSPVTGTITF